MSKRNPEHINGTVRSVSVSSPAVTQELEDRLEAALAVCQQRAEDIDLLSRRLQAAERARRWEIDEIRNHQATIRLLQNDLNAAHDAHEAQERRARKATIMAWVCLLTAGLAVTLKLAGV
ncbi:hypothetical protein [Pseudomonas phage PAXYB1]|uniref:Uncharacterized protein n=15 Tax=root TaxID=1 RepID=Q7Y2F4_BPKMV|nr:hypothetical protein phiKMVp11 [Pseudomonas phage phiKMV]YP_001522799.1 hypothetical protein PPLKD16_gp11 [Pseudomonas phage LKD16]YP_002117733.1 hypothetical protein HOS06_gp11 [Pseudomonas phage PT5]YP_002117792.1 hypothetical protein PT2_gp13 [Pseudomonas phage PT2]YP_006299933.1 hypothetical protein TM32_00011 [Pseudomonas phage vB_Pae-TbilisiM32]YP_008766778.1 hypothetical protein V417_gp12 [Pseudomonas phage MPK6]YP_009151814.1 hypothetical protein ACQ50_gp14 [Pseudomonas phage vB_Pa